MTQKKKISIQREDVFQEVDALLSEAMASLDDRNARVAELLQAESDPSIAVPEYAEVGDEDPAPAAEAAAEGEPESSGN